MQLEVKVGVFQRAVKTTAFVTVSPEIARSPVLSCIFFDICPTTFRAVATDGYRLAYFESGGHYCPKPVSFLLIAKELCALRLPSALDDTLKIVVGEQNVIIQSNNETFPLAIVQSPYLRYLAPFPPNDGSVVVQCRKADFVSVLAEARRQTTRKNRAVHIWIRQDYIAIAAAASGDPVLQKVPAQSSHQAYGAFNANYLRDALAALPPGEMKIRFRQPEPEQPIDAPLEFTSENQRLGIVRQLVAPRYW